MIKAFINDILNASIASPFESFDEIWGSLLSILRNPTRDIVSTITLLSIPAILTLLIGTILLIFVLPSDREYEDDEHEDEREEKRDIEEQLLPSDQAISDARKVRYVPQYGSWIFVLGLFSTLWVSVGFISQMNYTCLSCHDQDTHVQIISQGSHAQVTCVTCHEGVSAISSFGTPQALRIGHIISTFVTGDSLLYAYVPRERACIRCHDEILNEVVIHEDGIRRTRISHTQPVEAGLGCIGCHDTLSENSAGGTVRDTGMQSCIGCHDGVTAHSRCSYCHLNDPYFTRDSIARESARRLIFTPGDQQCYRCHDPGPCDSCHGGVRMPHSQDIIDGEGDHGPLSRRVGVEVCLMCHNREADCLTCHSTDTWVME